MIGNDHVRFGRGPSGKGASTTGTSPDGLPHPLQALVATFAANKTIVDQAAARAAVTEVTAE